MNAPVVKADRVILGAAEVVTCDPATGEGTAGRIPDGAVAFSGERIAWVGPATELKEKVELAPDAIEIDATGRSIVPGFVDSHTHLIFAGDRRTEFAARAAGRAYETGGILDTVAATRAASDEKLLALTLRRCDSLLRAGTTTVEAKSGYSLNSEGELRLLRILQQAREIHAMDIEVTFCGAHAVPAESDGDPDGYIELVCEEMIPQCAPAARWCDVFCDVGAFTPDQAERVLMAGTKHGLAPRIHANELASSGGAAVAARVRAASADHLLFLDQSEAKALAKSGCVGVLAPVTALGLGRMPDVGLMRDSGMTIALASDLNPGMAPSADLQLVAAIATRSMGMGPEDALLAMTTGGAQALRRDDIGKIARGFVADVLILGTDSFLDIGYAAGGNLVDTVIKRGSVIEP